MKSVRKMILGLLAGALVGVATLSISSETMTMVNCKYGQCQATAKSTGQQCKHCVSNQGDLYCWQHK